MTVIVPVYNGEPFLAEALQSIMEQNYQPLEVLVVDDGSTDRSAEVAATFPDVRVLRKEHSGIAATLNLGVSHGSGELFAFLDADDRWLPGKLASQIQELHRRPELDMVFGAVRQFFRRGDAESGSDVFSAPQPGINKTAMLVRRTSFLQVGGFAEEVDKHDFLDWYARAMAINLRAAMLPAVLAERRIHDRNMGRTDPAAQQRRYLTTLRAALNQRRQQSAPGQGAIGD